MIAAIFTTLLLLLLLCQVARSKHNPNLHFFSIWSTGAGAVTLPSPTLSNATINFFFDVNSTNSLIHLKQLGYGPSLLQVRTILFWPRHSANKGLRPDFAHRWNQTLVRLVPLLQDGSALGVFLGDELCWDCVRHSELKQAADLVRATLPPLNPLVAQKYNLTRPVIYYNEAFPPFDDRKMWNNSCGPAVAIEEGYPDVPSSIDWISMDYYPNEGTFKGAQRIYNTQIFPRMYPHQSVLFVPPAFSCSYGSSNAFVQRFCCSNTTRDGANPPCHGNCEVSHIQWAIDTYNWARSEHRFVGINPWYWEQPGGPPPSSWPPNHSDVPGLRWMPALKQVYIDIGKEIVSGRQGDVTPKSPKMSWSHQHR